MMTAKKYQLICEWFDEDKRLSERVANETEDKLTVEQADVLAKELKLHNLKKKIIQGMK